MGANEPLIGLIDQDDIPILLIRLFVHWLIDPPNVFVAPFSPASFQEAEDSASVFPRDALLLFPVSLAGLLLAGSVGGRSHCLQGGDVLIDVHLLASGKNTFRSCREQLHSS